MNVGAGTKHRPLAAQAEASFREAGWESSLEGARWAGRPGPVGARLWVHSSGPPTPGPIRTKGRCERRCSSRCWGSRCPWLDALSFPLKDGGGPQEDAAHRSFISPSLLPQLQPQF